MSCRGQGVEQTPLHPFTLLALAALVCPIACMIGEPIGGSPASSDEASNPQPTQVPQTAPTRGRPAPPPGWWG